MALSYIGSKYRYASRRKEANTIQMLVVCMENNIAASYAPLVLYLSFFHSSLVSGYSLLFYLKPLAQLPEPPDLHLPKLE